jgi:Holliday junction resolvase
MSTPYEQGRRFAYRVSLDLKRRGYEIIRSAGSKTKVDIVAFRDGDGVTEWLFVQAKKANGTCPPAERVELRRLAHIARAMPVVAYQSQPRKRIQYKVLIGRGPKDWRPWTPDEATS